MISFHASLKNPLSKRWDIIKVWTGMLPVQYKFWEIQIDKTTDIASVEFRWTTRQDHAGMFFCIGLLGLEVILNMYDCRHWNKQTNDWIDY